MKILPGEQNSLEWMVQRAGIPTASEFDSLVTPEFKIRTGQMPKTYLMRKLAEWWTGGPLPGFNSLDMDFGQILEDEARPFVEFETGCKIDRVGLITTDDGTIGCSPDGLIGGTCGVEIKCPAPQTHLAYLLGGCLPKEHAAQVFGGMFVTGLYRWKFVSYRRGFPTLILDIERDEDIEKSLGEALGAFLADFEAAKERLTTLNGGPNKNKPMPVPTVANPNADLDAMFPSDVPS